MVTKISTTADAYVRTTQARKAAEIERGRRPSDEIPPQDQRDIDFFTAAIAQQAAAEAFEAAADDVTNLKGYLVAALEEARAEFEACEGVETQLHTPPADTQVTHESLQAFADVCNDRQARIAALDTRRQTARGRVASALTSFRAFVVLAKQQRARDGLPSLPVILNDQTVYGFAGSLPYPAPLTAETATAILDAIALAAAPKVKGGLSSDQLCLREAEKSRAARLVREEEIRSILSRGRTEEPAPARGFEAR
jgi:hypothetical protein